MTLETILLLLSACVTIYIAGLLIKKQDKHHEETKELNDEVLYSLEEIKDEVTLLTNEEPTECTLSYLEMRMDSLNKCLSIIKNPKYRRNKHVKRKKNFADD